MYVYNPNECGLCIRASYKFFDCSLTVVAEVHICPTRIHLTSYSRFCLTDPNCQLSCICDCGKLTVHTRHMNATRDVPILPA